MIISGDAARHEDALRDLLDALQGTLDAIVDTCVLCVWLFVF